MVCEGAGISQVARNTPPPAINKSTRIIISREKFFMKIFGAKPLGIPLPLTAEGYA